MTGYFEKKLLELLSDIHRLEDKNGDLEAFLKIPTPTLDEIKELIDRFPDLFDVYECEERFLPLLSEIVGYRYKPTLDADFQRKLIALAVETYRRKGTFPSAHFDLRIAGAEADIQETYPEAMRLNHRARLNQNNLAGKVYSLGVYRVSSSFIISKLREILENTHPAGTRMFFTQRFQDSLQLMEQQTSGLSATFRKSTIGYGSLVFKLNRHSLNGNYALTSHRSHWNKQTVRHSNISDLHDFNHMQAADVRLASYAEAPISWAGNVMTIIEFL